MDRSNMTSSEDQLTKLLSESSTAQKKRVLVELLRELISGKSPGQRVPIEDPAGTLLGYVASLPAYVPVPADENSPEFFAELRRRGEQEPTLTPEEFFALLKVSC